MLFDIGEDPGEVHNLAAERPEEHRGMFAEMMDYFKKVGARIPKPNPAYDPKGYQADKEYRQRTAWGPFEGRRALDPDEKPAAAATDQ